MEMRNKKIFLILLIVLCCFGTAVSAAPDLQSQLALIADNAALWKQDVEFGLWGYIVTDLDGNGREEIISASLQGTGMYTYISIFEVSEDGSRLEEVKQDRKDSDSAPDIMTDRVKVFRDGDAGRDYYIFTDGIRNGYAEYYENKRAAWLEDGVWKEMPLAYKTVLFTDQDHSDESYTDPSGAAIGEEEYLSAEDLFFGNITPEEVCLNWQMTDAEGFAGMDRASLLSSLEASVSQECPAE